MRQVAQPQEDLLRVRSGNQLLEKERRTGRFQSACHKSRSGGAESSAGVDHFNGQETGARGKRKNGRLVDQNALFGFYQPTCGATRWSARPEASAPGTTGRRCRAPQNSADPNARVQQQRRLSYYMRIPNSRPAELGAGNHSGAVDATTRVHRSGTPQRQREGARSPGSPPRATAAPEGSAWL